MNKNIKKINDKYDEFGVLKTTLWQNIKKGDHVKYVTTYIENMKRKNKTLYGIWDGEKVEFKDKNKHVVRTTRWLEIE